MEVKAPSQSRPSSERELEKRGQDGIISYSASLNGKFLWGKKRRAVAEILKVGVIPQTSAGFAE